MATFSRINIRTPAEINHKQPNTDDLNANEVYKRELLSKIQKIPCQIGKYK